MIGTTEPLEPHKNTSRTQGQNRPPKSDLKKILGVFKVCGSGGSTGSNFANSLNKKDKSERKAEPRGAVPVVPVVPDDDLADVLLDTLPRDPAEVFHDAAIIAEGNDLDDYSALQAVALGEGYADLSQYLDDVLTHWRASIAGANPSTPAGRQAVSDSLDMLAIHGRDLARLGWSAVDLFAFHRVKGSLWHGIAFKLAGRAVCEVHRDFIRYRSDGDAKARTFWRGGAAPDAVPFFEINNNTKGEAHG